VKTPQTEAHAYNEILAGRLYSLTGTKAARTKLVRVNGKLSVASKIEDLDAAKNKKGIFKFAQEWGEGKSPAADGFATDAWLANWDAVGLSGDNLLFDSKGNLVRIDAGGSLLYRAQGGAKGNAFGNVVGEIDTLRGAGSSVSNPATKVYGKLTDKEIYESIDRVLAVSDKEIGEVVSLWGPGDEWAKQALIKKLVKRKKDLALRRDFFYKRSKGIKPPPIPRELGDKWGIRVELDRERFSTKTIETMPETGPAFLPDVGSGDTRKDPAFLRKWEKWSRDITPEQRAAIRGWSGSRYKEMRAAQVGAEKATGAKLSASSSINKDVLRVESALHHAPRYSGKIHRGMRWKTREYGYPNFDEGDVFELEAISSFSTNTSTARSFSGVGVGNKGHGTDVPVIFHVDDSYSGVDIKSLSSYKNESEVLALRKSRYRIKSIKRHDDEVSARTGRVSRYGLIEIFLEEISGKE